MIKHCLKFKPKITIKISCDLIEHIKNIILPENAKLVSVDVQILFPSISPQEIVQLVD